MKQTSVLLETGLIEEYNPPKPMTVREIMKLKKLDPELKNFGILLNGKNIDLDTIVEPGDKFVILPHLKGG